MESKINPNDPAYPINIPEGHTLVNGIPGNGLTKREYFAGLAMQGLLANPVHSRKSALTMENWWRRLFALAYKSESTYGRDIPQHAAMISDQLIAELNKPVTP